MKQPPSIHKRSFDCPHCGAFAQQQWYHTRPDPLDEQTPAFPPADAIDAIAKDRDMSEQQRTEMLSWVKQIRSRRIFLEKSGQRISERVFRNISISECYACHKFSVWVGDRVVHPRSIAAPPANPDMPDKVSEAFEEARRIVNESPRGAAALLRLCVQYLCVHLGAAGTTIDQNIADLVKKGLNPLIQRSLDVVRVIGNESVHPGTIDLDDDNETATSLFILVNAIVDQMITHPKHVNALYSQLPPGKLKAIEKRDSISSRSRPH